MPVVVLERAPAPGGKMREVRAGGARLDAGPTVSTMRRVFEDLFADAGARLCDHLSLRPAGVLARHAWSARERLDLHADPARTAEAIGRFSGPAEAARYLGFVEHARRVYRTLEGPFIRAPRPTPSRRRARFVEISSTPTRTWAGMPSMVAISAWPWDSPAVVKRSSGMVRVLAGA